MTTISAQSILASKHAQTGDRVDTLLLRYPRWIHAEGRTHRLFRIGEKEDIVWAPRTPSPMEDPNLSRNAASSRAMPVEKMIEDVLLDTAAPLYWGANQKGMQAEEECDNLIPVFPGSVVPNAISRERAWLQARDEAIRWARAFAEAGYHKQICNRLLEPFSHITALVSATNWSNFLALRDHPDAEPHIRMLAQAVRKALDEADVQTLEPGDWHLPFITTDDFARLVALYGIGNVDAIRRAEIALSVARCASTSYKTVDGFDMTLDRAIELHDKLVGSTPLHASPCEHVCQADEYNDDFGFYMRPGQHGNFVGFRQYRKMLPNECL